jgi:hypothetical protein
MPYRQKVSRQQKQHNFVGMTAYRRKETLKVYTNIKMAKEQERSGVGG